MYGAQGHGNDRRTFLALCHDELCGSGSDAAQIAEEIVICRLVRLYKVRVLGIIEEGGRKELHLATQKNRADDMPSLARLGKLLLFSIKKNGNLDKKGILHRYLD
ncbi:hypothetical protein TNCV_332811 [Trichonephila clavipes]|nr:hypothetical protein TNCV_332811 [Trichonephila clavipes]